MTKYVFIFTLLLISHFSFAGKETAQYVGSQICAQCHQKQVDDWKGSHHELSMKHASEDTVLGDFDNYQLSENGRTTLFYRENEQFWVKMENEKGELEKYQIKYTFGWEPLQQYMVEFEDGRVQLIPYSWDSREVSNRDSRWFALHPDVKPYDEFYWRNAGQNWNYMCADCHSTNVQKNYNATENSYNTTWSEINVACESCHGPASKHIQATSTKPTPNNFGFERNLAQRVVEWISRDGHATLEPNQIQPTDQVQVCAQCHSRRVQLNDNPLTAQHSLLDKYQPSLITDELYYPDGQVFDENYVYGSFLQSKMAAKGVTCTNCHDPHSAKLKLPEPALCNQCHSAEKFNTTKHTFHDVNSEASQCSNCHMPKRTYMQIDERRDHYWHVPKPEINHVSGGTSTCRSCHSDKTELWAVKQLNTGYPDRNSSLADTRIYSDYLLAKDKQSSLDVLIQFIQQEERPEIVTASSLLKLKKYDSPKALPVLEQAAQSDNELIRMSVAQASSRLPVSQRWPLLKTLLEDEVLAVRSESARALAVDWNTLNSQQREQLKAPLSEYIDIQTFNADRAYARANLGDLYRFQGEVEQSIQQYQKAIEVEPYYESSYVNLADVYRAIDRNDLAISTLQQGLVYQPRSSAIPFSLGLALLRNREINKAALYLKAAAEKSNSNDYYWYVYSRAVESLDVRKSILALDRALKVSNKSVYLDLICELIDKNSLATDQQYAGYNCAQLNQ